MRIALSHQDFGLHFRIRSMERVSCALLDPPLSNMQLTSLLDFKMGQQTKRTAKVTCPPPPWSDVSVTPSLGFDQSLALSAGPIITSTESITAETCKLLEGAVSGFKSSSLST